MNLHGGPLCGGRGNNHLAKIRPSEANARIALRENILDVYSYYQAKRVLFFFFLKKFFLSSVLWFLGVFFFSF